MMVDYKALAFERAEEIQRLTGKLADMRRDRDGIAAMFRATYRVCTDRIDNQMSEIKRATEELKRVNEL